MQLVQVKSASATYPVYIGKGLLHQVGGLYRRHGLKGRALVVSDETVMDLYGQAVLQALSASDIETVSVAVPPGETSKSLEAADGLYERLIRHRFDRDAVVVAVGGGVVGDLAGFVAATYVRGVSLVHVPTSLLAQVDSAVGGKVGVNHRLGKNLVGAFHAPALVVADLDCLQSLPLREWNCGLAEVIKYGVIADRTLFEQLERSCQRLREDPLALEALVTRCVQIKAQVVAQDEREAGPRKVLNFGHTLGHALESLTGYQHFNHGEAVLWGMLGEAYLSYRFGTLSEMDFVRVRRLILQLEKPALPPLSARALLEHVQRDKKNREGRVHMAWLRHIGSCAIEPINPEQMLSVLDFWQRESRARHAAA